MEGKGWNRGAAGLPRKPKKKGLPIATLAVVAVAVAAGVGYFALQGGKKPVAPADAKVGHGAIREVAPVVVTNRPATAAEPVKIHRNMETYRDERGILRYKIGNGRAPDPTRPKRTVNLNRDENGNRRHPTFAIFKSVPENEIALLVSITPGTMLAGSRTYNKKFEQDFMKSLETKIEVLPTDTPREAALKKTVQETKEEIKRRVDAGENLCDIFREARKELTKMAAYKLDLKRQVAKIVREGNFTESDVEDCVKAANQMLAEKGISPISKSCFVRGNLKMQVEAQKERK